MTRNADEGGEQGRTVSRRSVLATGGTAGALSVAGCIGRLTGGGSSDTITVGHLAPAELDMGKGSMRSARMAVEKINKNGGILGKDVELITGDTASKPSQTNTLVQEMIGKGAKMISGTFVSEATLAITGRVGQSNVPFLDTGAASPKITGNYPAKSYEQYKNIFRNNPANSTYQARYLGDYAKFLSEKYGWQKFAVVVEDAEWTTEISKFTPKRMKEHGLTVAANKRIAPDTTDFTPTLDAVEASGAKSMIKAFAHLPGTAMLSDWATNKYPFSQEGINVSSMSPSYWADTNGGCLYETMGVSAAGGFAPITEKTEPFMDAYRKKHNSRPGTPMYMGFGTYDAHFIYKNAVEAAGTADYTKDLDAIVAELEQTDYTGTCGRVKFFPKGHKHAHDVQPGLDLSPFPVVQWQKADNGNGLAGSSGTKVCVWPEKYATGEHKKPAWM